jgi:DNA-binding transcriptional regulator YhcF (GntR family)
LEQRIVFTEKRYRGRKPKKTPNIDADTPKNLVKMTETEQSLFDWIEDQARLGNTGRLPTIRDFAAEYGLSVERVSKVLHALKAEGILRMSRKSGITIPVPEKTADKSTLREPTDAVERLYRIIMSEIQEGIRAAGSSLPKVGIMAQERRTSRVTVCRTYERLRREGLVHRRGRQTIVGNANPIRAIGIQPKEKCVIVVQYHSNAFKDMMVHRWSRDFAFAFIREMSLIGGRAIPVSASETGANDTHYSSKRKIADLVTELGDRCIGFLVAGEAWFYSTTGFIELHELISWLCTFGRPVTWFDSMDAAGNYRNEKGTRDKIRGILAKPHVRSRFVRCRFNERGAMKIVAQSVSQAGYTTLRIPHLSVPEPHKWSWADQRCDLLRAVVEEEGFPLTLEVRKFEHDINEPVESVLKKMSASESPVREYFLSNFRRPIDTEFYRVPSDLRYMLELSFLSDFVTPRAGVCFFALNDHMAYAYCRRIEILGRSPSRIRSLVSFDDCLDVLFPYQVSSVNVGFDLLGYKAFHFLLGDIPLRIGRSRSIDALARITHLHTLRPAE